MRKYPLPVALLLLTLAAGTGCVQRKMVITSEPEGATVTINQTWKITTPDEFSFKHYGTYLIRLEKPGYYPLLVKEPIVAPLYQKTGLDFVSEVGPGNYRDVHKLHYKLEKIEEADPIPELMSRGDKMRQHIAKVADERKKRDENRRTRTLPLPTKKKVKKKEESEKSDPPSDPTPKANPKAADPEIE